MDKNSQHNSEQTAVRLRRFHEQSRRQPKEPIHSDKILAICAWIIAIGGAIISFSVFKGLEAAVSAFLSISTAVFLYTVARIYTTLREIRDNHPVN